MPSRVPRRVWHSSMIAPMNSLGARIVARTTGSCTSSILPSGNSLGLVTVCSRAVLHGHAVDHVGRGGDQVEPELALQPLPDHLQVQQAEEADAEAEAEGGGGLRLVDQRGVVELELVQGVAQLRVVGAVQRIQARRTPSASGPCSRRAPRSAPLCSGGDRVADLGLADVLHAGDQIAHLADAEAVGRGHLRRVDADLQQLVGGAGGHHPDALALAELAVDDT